MNIGQDYRVYFFKYLKVDNCYDCPLCYDYMHCTIAGEKIEVTDYDDGKRPDNCPLKELI